RLTGWKINLEDLRVPLDRTVLPQAAKTRTPIVYEDIREDPSNQGNVLMAKVGARSVVRIPLVVQERLIGAINYTRLHLKPFTPDQISILQDLTPLIATALANALAFEEATKQSERYKLLLKVGQAANSALELDDVLAQAVEALHAFVPLYGVALISLKDGFFTREGIHLVSGKRHKGEGIREVFARVRGQDLPPSAYRLPYEATGFARNENTNKLIVIEDVQKNPRFAEDKLAATLGVRSSVRGLLRVQDRTIGAIDYSRIELYPFTPEQISILEDVTPLLATALANAMAYEEIKRLKNQLEQENVVLREEIEGSGMFEEIVGSSKSLRQVIAQIEKVARTDSTVLITGETGVGKELIARALHRRSTRANHPMIKVSCASLPATLIAQALFAPGTRPSTAPG